MVTACALIAAFDEERHVAQVVSGALRHVAQVFVVDDGSTDRTAEEARRAGATVVRHDRNLGKGQALRTGLAAVLSLPFTHVVFLDADLQHDPAEIPRLLEGVLSWLIGADVLDSQSGFRIIQSDWLRKVRLTGRGYEIETEMLIKLARAGATLDRVPVSRLRYEGVRSHIRPFRDTFRTCMLALRYRFLENSKRHV
jgi:glycosyltransferase involved in cell wall biosynthesis